jgi:hypothetical protein
VVICHGPSVARPVNALLLCLDNKFSRSPVAPGSSDKIVKSRHALFAGFIDAIGPTGSAEGISRTSQSAKLSTWQR